MAIKETSETTKDSSTGVIRELTAGYTKSDVLPGTTIIPSHDGEFGGQLGVDPHEPMPFVVDPDYKDGGFIVDPRVTNINQGTATLGGNATERLRALSGNPPEKAQEGLMPKQAQSTQSEAATKKGKQSKPQPAPTTPAQADYSKIIAAVVSEMNNNRRAEVTPAIRSETVETSQRTPMQTMPDNGVPTPEVEVTFITKDGGRIITQFHEVVQAQSTIALVFDSRFKYGSRYIPAETTEDSPMKIVLQPHNKTYNVFYFGQMFRFQTWDFMILLLAEDSA